MIVVRVVRHGNSHALVIPRPLLRDLGWQPADLVELSVDTDGLRARHLDSLLARIRRRKGGQRGQATGAAGD